MAGRSEQKVKIEDKRCSFHLVWSLMMCNFNITVSNYSSTSASPRPRPAINCDATLHACHSMIHALHRAGQRIQLLSRLSSRMESVPVDVATLSELSESSILSCLEERFSNQHFQVGSLDRITLFMCRACIICGMNKSST